ncbi:MAG: ABC transporter substrate-binding protein [Cocleimonas sp.]|nr:ABC transporter substrate-binding protein [Cocleimonas sp.]
MSQHKIRKISLSLLLCILSLGISSSAFAEDGVNSDTIRIGGVLALKGNSKGLGINMKAGIDAAFDGAIVKNRSVIYVTRNDSYRPEQTITATKALIKEKVFIFAGNVGTPTAKVSLPLLAKHNIPAVGFFTGADLLRPGKGAIINYRASYVQETAKVIKAALDHGIKANQVCAYVQNDAYGMAGITGIIKALEATNKSKPSIAALKKIKALTGENPQRNGIGPVGVYKRNRTFAREGYKSLRAWEKSQNTRCKIVVTVGSYKSITEFIAYSRYKKDPWVFSAVSFTGASNFRDELVTLDVKENVIMTQVVPFLNSATPLVTEARNKLGSQFGYVSLEGFIVGKLILYGLNKIEGDITRKKFMRGLSDASFSVQQLALDYLNDNQGSDLVNMTILKQGNWQPANSTTIWKNKP